MKFLVSVAPPSGEVSDNWAPGGEPVVPSYPHNPQNLFIAIPSFKPAQFAEVVDDPGIDVDQVAKALKAEYPCLPAKMHDNYVLEIARAAHDYPEGTRFRIFVEYSTAELRMVGDELNNTRVLWKELPL